MDRWPSPAARRIAGCRTTTTLPRALARRRCRSRPRWCRISKMLSMRRRGTLLFPRADGEMRTEADKARQAHPDRAQPRWDRRELPAHLPALQSARALRTRRSTLTASAVTARAAGCSYGPRRCLVVSACMTRGTNERDVGSSRPRRSLRSRADPPPQRPEDHLRDLRPPRARLPARRRSIACEAREICCIRGNQALLESCPRGAFSG